MGRVIGDATFPANHFPYSLLGPAVAAKAAGRRPLAEHREDARLLIRSEPGQRTRVRAAVERL